MFELEIGMRKCNLFVVLERLMKGSFFTVLSSVVKGKSFTVMMLIC